MVIHDLVCKNGGKTFNIDHVVVGPTGVFSIETKNWERADGTHHQIFYDGKRILVDGKAPDCSAEYGDSPRISTSN